MGLFFLSQEVTSTLLQLNVFLIGQIWREIVSENAPSVMNLLHAPGRCRQGLI